MLEVMPGPRTCIGMAFAMTATLLQSVRSELEPRKSLRPRGPLRVAVVRR